MATSKSKYSNEFYNTIAEGSRRSAAAVQPHIGVPDTVLDVGCGQGWWGKEFESHGSTVLGIDGVYVQDPVIPFKAVDISQPFDLKQTFDVVICLEVAEHLPESRAASFVHDLCNHAISSVLFSAAMPRQGGVGHVNCQPPSYWAALFREHDFGWEDNIRRNVWQDTDVEPWYRANMLLFIANGGDLTNDPDHIIPPDLWLDPMT